MSDTLRELAALPTAAAAEAAAPDTAALVQAAQAAARDDLQCELTLAPRLARVCGAWGLVIGELRGADGGRFDFVGTPLQEAAAAGFASREAAALLARRDGRWQVVEQRLGLTDLPWPAWAARHAAPAALFAHAA